jgi:Bifunctional DNA primase/polymerase, N-terminal
MIATISDSLTHLPANWELVPVRGKAPYKKDWTKLDFSRDKIIEEIDKGSATGCGLKLGINGYLAIDIDGESAKELLKSLAPEGATEISKNTVSWTSGKIGRGQYLFQVREADRSRIRNRRILTGKTDENGKAEALEFRWIGMQSVLPPSIHPETGKPYRWLNNPAYSPVAEAPEWLINLNENWKAEYTGENSLELLRFPARLYKHFRRPMALWLLARYWDISRHDHEGNNKGCGIGTFTIAAAAALLGRSSGHIRKLLCQAKKSGLIRNYTQRGDRVTVYYTALEKVIEIAGIGNDLGPIAAIELESLENLHIRATEVEAQFLQRRSQHPCRKQEIAELEQKGINPADVRSRIEKPETLLSPCEYPARVLGRGARFIYCEPDFLFYGGSQVAIGAQRGICQRTVSRHLSNSYRLQPAAQRGYRQGLEPIIKGQLAEQLPKLKGASSPEMRRLFSEDGLFFYFDSWWKPRCNIYSLSHRLISAKRRRVVLRDKFSSTPDFSERERDFSISLENLEFQQ